MSHCGGLAGFFGRERGSERRKGRDGVSQRAGWDGRGMGPGKGNGEWRMGREGMGTGGHVLQDSVDFLADVCAHRFGRVPG